MSAETAITLEVCVASVLDAQEAVSGGADRLELNSALELGGLTPSCGLLAEVKQAVSVPVIVMIRPRGAGFCYCAEELQVMLHDATQLLHLGADGIAFGILTPDMQVDVEACRPFVQLAGQRTTVFHRAFDITADPHQALRQLIALGVQRVLTSGQAESAIAGVELIATLQQQYAGQIEILPGAGVRPDNVRRLLEHTGCGQVHGSFSKSMRDDAGVVAGSEYRLTDRQLVRQMRERLA